MIRYDTAPTAAEASLKSASADTVRLEDEIAALEEQSEQVQAENWSTPEEEADISRRVNELDSKIGDLQSDLQSANEFLSSTHDYWFEEIGDGEGPDE